MIHKVTNLVLNTFCERIEYTFRRLYPLEKNPAQCVGGRYYPSSGTVEFPLVLGGRLRVQNAIAARNTLAADLRDDSVRVYQDNTGTVVVEVQVTSPQPKTYDDLFRATQEQPKYSFPVGFTKKGHPYFIHLDDPSSPHMLVSGATGSGKTAMVHTAMSILCHTHSPDELRIVVADYAVRSASWLLRDISKHLLFDVPANSIESCAALVKIADEMYTRNPATKILIYVDEMSRMCSEMEDICHALEKIAQEGRKYGVHLIGCTQKPTSEAIGSLMKSNMRRAIFRVHSPEDSKVASGMSQVGAEHLRGHGSFIYIGDDYERLNSVLMPDYGIITSYSVPEKPKALLTTTTQEPEDSLFVGGITTQNIAKAMQMLTDEGKPISKAGVLRLMGYRQEGGASKRINQKWESAESLYRATAALVSPNTTVRAQL